MASGYSGHMKPPKLAKIRTSDILQELTQTNGNNRDLFFLLVSTRGKEDISTEDSDLMNSMVQI